MPPQEQKKKRVLVVGAGAAGEVDFLAGQCA